MEEKEIAMSMLHEALNYAAMMACITRVSMDYDKETGFHLKVITLGNNEEIEIE